MSTLLNACMLGVAIVAVAAAHAEEHMPVLNLREIEPLSIAIGGPGVILTVTPQTTIPVAVTNRVRVTYGADLIGFARIQQAGRSPGRNSFILSFETQEQAAAAGKLLQWLNDPTPAPLPDEAQSERD